MTPLRTLPYRPSAIEVASGMILGFAPPEALPSPDGASSPVAALEQAILPALLRPPCLVCFSGGPQSSAMLAVAVQLARREGLELPVPATWRAPDHDRHEERNRQERVIVHLGLLDWARFELLHDELDVVGPVAMSMLRRHGLMPSFRLHCHMPLIVEASGGSLITTGGRDLAPSDDLRGLSWLRPEARDEIWSRCQVDLASEPLYWKDHYAWLRRLRAVRVAIEALAHVAARLRVTVVHPLCDPMFAAALQRLPRAVGMSQLFGDLLPADVLAGPRQQSLGAALWSRHSRAFVEKWDGVGLAGDIVDEERLRLEWSMSFPHPRTFLLLQSVALAYEGRSVARQLAEAVRGFG